jgi:hypothetical protein
LRRTIVILLLITFIANNVLFSVSQLLAYSSGINPAQTLDLIELQREMVMERQLAAPKLVTLGLPLAQPGIITLDTSLSKIQPPIEIERGKSIVLSGRNIKRFLVTTPDIITVEKKDADTLMVTGKDVGYTYLHAWDDNGRWTTEWLGILPKPEGPTYDELMRRQEELARNFKFRYSLDWTEFASGRRIENLERSSYNWLHNLSLTGETPYGDFDSSASVRRDATTNTDLTAFTIGLTEGQLGPFKGFTLRGFDFYPDFSNLAFPAETLRGVMLNSPAFENKLDYTAFWGREGGGRFGNLSPSLAKIKNSFLSGINLDYTPTEKQEYQFSALHGWGRDRLNYLNAYGYDAIANWDLKPWDWEYELGYDCEQFANLLTGTYTGNNLNFSAELRAINKDYLSITGTGYRQGERGGLFNLNYKPTEKLDIRSTLDVYQDRLYPAEDKRNRLNEDFDFGASYQVDNYSSLNLNYILRNDLGHVGQYRYQSPSIGYTRTFRALERDIPLFVNYYHQENKNYSSHSSDYINDKFYAGLTFSLIGNIYYYFNKEINWLCARYTDDHSMPNAIETGITWSDQISTSPFFGEFSFTYRDEEDADSPLAFLAGEDYIEGYTQLSYRPTPDNELYASVRCRNIWADRSDVSKRLEYDFNAGLRYLWDTGVRWDAVGSIEGYVFKDLNSDGLRQRDDPPIEGAKVWLGQDKFQVTDIFGYYKFNGVKARRAYVVLDATTLPVGYVLTVPVTQEVAVAHMGIVRADFGVTSRSEISGLVFEDKDGDGEYTQQDKGVGAVTIILDENKKTVTDSFGKYSFPNIATGEHLLTLDLTTLPVYYLPKVAITKKVMLSEGMTYLYNIPLKRTQE